MESGTRTCTPIAQGSSEGCESATQICVSSGHEFKGLSAAASCKRHLEKYIATEYFVCPSNGPYGCKDTFMRKVDFDKIHRYQCFWLALANALTDPVTRQRTLQVYVCPFTGVYFGDDVTNYLDHLVRLGAGCGTRKPAQNLLRKLRKMLEHAADRPTLNGRSTEHLGDAGA